MTTTATTAIHRFVDQARAGNLNRVVTRLSSGWVVLGPSQLLAGYCLLLPDPVVPSLNDLDPAHRQDFLLDMARVGDAILKICKPLKLNYAMLGNVEPALHAHIIPRYHHEPDALRKQAIWSYPPTIWDAPDHAFDPHRHASLIQELAQALSPFSR